MAFLNEIYNKLGLIGLRIRSGRAAQIPLVIKLAASQTANALEIRNSSDTVLASIDASGNLGAGAASVGSAELAANTIQYAEVSLTKAEILTLNTVGKTLVAAPGAGKVIEFISMLLIHDFGVAAYTGGGTINVLHDATVVSNVIAAASAFGSAADSMAFCVALDTANGIILAANKALNLKCNTGDFTDPGTAVGVGRVKVAYRVHDTGL